MKVAAMPGSLQRAREVLRRQHCSLRRERTSTCRIRDLVHFNDRVHPRELPAATLGRHPGTLRTER